MRPLWLAASLLVLSCEHARPAERSLIPQAALDQGKRDLSPSESRVLADQGVVVLSKGAVHSFHVGYAALFHANQPVYITADSLLHAWHSSYDTVLQQLEVDALIPALKQLLDELRAQLASRGPSEARADLDPYLSVAHALLTGDAVVPVAGADPARALALVELCEKAEGAGDLALFGSSSDFDFSMLKPRGHYTRSAALQRYYRAMSFLGRVELRLAHQVEGKWEVDRRTLRGAALLEAIFSPRAHETWQHLDATLSAFVGPPDSMSLPGLSRGLGVLGKVDQASDAAVAAAFEGVARQRIHTQLELAGSQTIAFVLLGQRFVYDSKVLSELTYGALQTNPYRMMPSPLDVASSVFHHPLARELLEPEVTRYGPVFAQALDAQWKRGAAFPDLRP